MAVDTLKSFQAAQRVLADVTGIKVVHGVTPLASGSGAHAILRPATDQLEDAPAIVLGAGPIAIIPGPLTRLTWTLIGGIWRTRTAEDLAASYDGLVGDAGRLVEAIQARGKAYAIQAELQSLSWPAGQQIEAIDGVEWPAGSNRWFLVLPFRLELVADYATPPQPA